MMITEKLRRALVVDDDEQMRRFLKAKLERLEVEVVGEAENGEAAIQSFEELRPDVTLLDIEMPVKNGIEALKGILEKDPNAVVIMLTGISDMDVADSCIELGAKSYVRKGATSAVFDLMLKQGLGLE